MQSVSGGSECVRWTEKTEWGNVQEVLGSHRKSRGAGANGEGNDLSRVDEGGGKVRRREDAEEEVCEATEWSASIDENVRE